MKENIALSYLLATQQSVHQNRSECKLPDSTEEFRWDSQTLRTAAKEPAPPETKTSCTLKSKHLHLCQAVSAAAFVTVSGGYAAFHICFIETIICSLSKLFSKDKAITPRTSKSSPLFHIHTNYLVFQMILRTFNHYRLIRWHIEPSKTLKS